MALEESSSVFAVDHMDYSSSHVSGRGCSGGGCFSPPGVLTQAV